VTRIMRDSTTPADIPVAGTQLVAGYANGIYQWTPDGYARFPGIPHVYIDVNGTDPAGAGVLDIEQGDASIATAVSWVKARTALKPGAYPPIIYCDRSNMGLLTEAMTAAGLHIVKDYRLWVATLDGTAVLPDMLGVTAVQCKGEKMTGGHYDESIVYDDTWHAPAPPPPPPPPAPQYGYLVVHGNLAALTGRAVASLDGGRTWA